MRAVERIPIRRVLHGTVRDRPKKAPLPVQIDYSLRNLLKEPTWSVKSLLPLEPSSRLDALANQDEEITKEKLYHLLRLSALPLPKTAEEENKLLASLRRHLHFVRAVQEVDTTKPPTWHYPRADQNDPVLSSMYPSPKEVKGQDNAIREPLEEVEPLVAIRDETYDGISEATIKLADMQPALDKEEKRGMNGAVRRTWKVNTNWNADETINTDALSNDEASRLDAETIAKRESKLEALAEKRDWWVDVDRLGSGLESRKKGKYFFVKRGAKNS